MPISLNREYRAMPLLSPTETEGRRLESTHYVEGYATTFDAPYLLFDDGETKYFEIVERTALEGADMSDVIMQYDHAGKVFARQSNNTLLLAPDEKGLFICADLSKSPAAQELHGEIESGLITKMSWCFIVAEEAYDQATHTRRIKRIKKVFDVSAVSIPANAGTEISARSFVDGVIDIEKREALALKRRRLLLLTDLEGKHR